MRYQPTVDRLGNGEDDYQTMLVMEALHAGQHVGNLPEAERQKYCCKAVYNAQLSFARKRRSVLAREGSTVLLSALTEHDAPMADSAEAAQNARESLELLQAQFSQREWDMLMRVGLADGNQVEAYDPQVDGGSVNYFCKQVRRLRERARKLLRQDEE